MREPIRKLPMQRRMMLTFAVPVIAVVMIVFYLGYPYILNRYKEQMRYSQEQSISQAVAFTESYLHNLAYFADLIENSWEIQEILSKKDFREEKADIDRYLEFYTLNREFNVYELENKMYRFCLYVPDGIAYSNNAYFFHKESRLKERNDYEQIREAFAKGKNYISLSRERESASTLAAIPMLTLYHRINDKEGMHTETGVCSVSINVNYLINIMKNANITRNGLVCLTDAEGKTLMTSNENLAKELGEWINELEETEQTNWAKLMIKGENYYYGKGTVGQEGWSMLTLIPAEEYDGPVRMIQLMAAGMIIAIIAVIIIVSYALSLFYVNRLTSLRQKMRELQEGNLTVKMPLSAGGDEIEEVYRNFNFMIEEVRRLMQEHYRLGKEVKMAEIKALQAQINPHFLYNTLDLINWIAMDYEADKIADIACNLALFYRRSLNKGKSLISIGQETEHVEAYVNIENFHFDNAISLKTEIPEELKNLACLNIILQPFVENAIVHGMAEHTEITSCAILIRAQRQEDDILFMVRDDGPGMSKEQMEDAVTIDQMQRQTKGYGIKNINFRLKLCFGQKYGIQYESEIGKGTTVYIRIPALTMEEAEKIIY